MKNLFVFVIALLASLSQLQAQKFMTRTGHIKFYSHTAVEDIEANNHQVTSVLDTGTGDLVFAVLMKSFQFEKALMQEHFNEKYVESEKFPKSTFKGKITNLSEINFAKNGSYKTKVEGVLTIHGIAKEIVTEGTLVVEEGKISANAKFPVTVADYEIKIPAVVKDNIAKEMEVTVEMNYQPYSQEN
ncbi:MAG: YceI family protein [Bacteroidia bacterium]|nr:YceI family protein [Bacteroidia bacterium]